MPNVCDAVRCYTKFALFFFSFNVLHNNRIFSIRSSQGIVFQKKIVFFLVILFMTRSIPYTYVNRSLFQLQHFIQFPFNLVLCCFRFIYLVFFFCSSLTLFLYVCIAYSFKWRISAMFNAREILAVEYKNEYKSNLFNSFPFVPRLSLICTEHQSIDDVRHISRIISIF